MIQLLNAPPASQRSERGLEASYRLERRKRLALNDIAQKFSDGPARFLRNSTATSHAESNKAIFKIFQQAGDLSSQLWAQKTALEIKTYAELKRNHFTSRSSIMEAHSSHVLDDPEDQRLDGKLVQVVVHPAILSYGNNEGGDYSNFRVWAKASVWLG